MFKTARVHRVSQNILDQIRDAILAGDLKPGDRLPSEKELAESFGVSKASLREAFRALPRQLATRTGQRPRATGRFRVRTTVPYRVPQRLDLPERRSGHSILGEWVDLSGYW